MSSSLPSAQPSSPGKLVVVPSSFRYDATYGPDVEPEPVLDADVGAVLVRRPDRWQTARRRLAAPVAGYKVVDRSYRTLVGTPKVTMRTPGVVHALEGNDIALGQRGFHLCQHPLEVLRFVDTAQLGRYRLLAVTVPAGSWIRYCRRTRQYVASAVRVDREVPLDAATLFTGAVDYPWRRCYRRRHYRAGRLTGLELIYP
jgi:hypothetical protein